MLWALAWEGGWWLVPAGLAWLAIELADQTPRQVPDRTPACVTSRWIVRALLNKLPAILRGSSRILTDVSVSEVRGQVSRRAR